MEPEQLTFGEIVQKSCEFLIRKKIPSPKCDAEWIVAQVTGKTRLELYLNYNDIVPGNCLASIRNLVMERGKRIPLQHLLQSVAFCNLFLKCDGRALIPRPETERLVELVIEKLNPNFEGKIIDLGSGSGSIVLALCNHFKLSHGIGLDISEDAIDLSIENLHLTGFEDRVSFKQFDWVKNTFHAEPCDVVVSNPPYLTEEEWVSSEPEVKYHDPKHALVSPDSGLGHIKSAVKFGVALLKSGGLFAVEVGLGQADIVVEIMKNHYCNIDVAKDFSSVRRYVFGTKV